MSPKIAQMLEAISKKMNVNKRVLMMLGDTDVIETADIKLKT